MSKPSTTSHWRIPLVRELAIVLAIKLVILIAIKMIWFTEPTSPVNGSVRVNERLLGTIEPQSQPLRVDDEEPPK
ncbi:cytochrome oxidase putative small subunit CydP [Azomonas macrocytogenes]|uniref:Uncharacterized protein n=1 Tax=Azomonas macrocytogenes TaxID=69962 RepID=A0A839SZQ4_AZOMA|nr:cytochrome oxidase putative small subunit CydP [Azomonas macrocytogenes]MBB3101760.1 hypothetical protein [Azomonas macrocytogenes]